MEIILASSSPVRKQLLTSLKIKFKTVASNVDESKLKKTINSPKTLVSKLAVLKAKTVVHKLIKTKKINKKEKFVVIGADSLAAIKTKKGWLLLDKPKNKFQARQMALLMRNKTHQFYTGLALINNQGKQKTAVVCSKVKFKNFSNKTLANHINSKAWLNKAGGYDLQQSLDQLIEGYQGSYTNILGLPLKKLKQMLKKFKVNSLKGGD
jgi:septum formation protein